MCADDDHDDVGAIVPAQVPARPHAEHALARVEDRDCFEAPRIRGKCGKGRHGSDKDRAMLTYHMRSVKQARKNHKALSAVVSRLNGSTFKKDGRSFRIVAKSKSKNARGIILSISPERRRGNRFVRKIHFSKFIQASFSASTSNMAVAAKLDLHASTVPRLQKTCASLAQSTQTKLLLLMLQFCQRKRPIGVFQPRVLRSRFLP